MVPSLRSIGTPATGRSGPGEPLAGACVRALFEAARREGAGTRQQLRAAARRFVRRHRRNEGFLRAVLRGVARSSCFALVVLSLGRPALPDFVAVPLDETPLPPPVAQLEGFSISVNFVDIDGDTDLDLFVGTRTFYENVGTPESPVFSRARLFTGSPLAAFDLDPFSTLTFADIDADGDPDVVSGAGYGTFNFLENTGSVTSPAFVARSGTQNPLTGFDVGIISTPVLVDLDGDADFDLVSGSSTYVSPGGTFAFFENTGSTTTPRFNERTGAQNPLAAFDAGASSNPVFLDLDGDGDPDLAARGSDAVPPFFENTGTATAPAFVERTGSLSPLPDAFLTDDCRPTFADLDGDGDLDAVGCDPVLFLPFLLSYFENTGTAADPAFLRRSGLEDPFRGFRGLNLAFGDLDGDGDPDALATDRAPVTQGARAGNRFFFFENAGVATAPLFVARTGSANPLDGVTVCAGASPAIVDIDADGDLDVVSGTLSRASSVCASSPTFVLFENIGTAHDPVFEERTGSGNPMAGFSRSLTRPAFVDIDADGDFDHFSSNISGLAVAYHENVGSAGNPSFAERTGSQNPLDGAQSVRLAFVDVDGDGDQDALAGEGILLENVGSPERPRFIERTGADNPFSGLVGIAPAVVDIDGDCDFEVFSVDTFFEFGGDHLAFFENTTPDPDGDGVGIACDNCLAVANASQVDADGDAAGNACDGDLDQTGLTSISDFNVFAGCFGKSVPAASPPREPALTHDPSCEGSDLDGDGGVQGADFDLFRRQFGRRPGP